MIFFQKVTDWYLENKRILPWREKNEAYFIWISEIILQQTRVSQGLDYYINFTNRFKNVFELAHASEDEVMKYWQGLGYYSRARNLHVAAKTIVEQYNGIFPNEYSDLLKIKGIGEYTAAAIASIAFEKPFAVYDGNIKRVFSRFFGFFENINSPELKKKILDIANEHIKNYLPSIFNQSLMEFGALQCVPKNPNCENCFAKNDCFAYQNNQVVDLPAKKIIIEKKTRFFNYLVIHYNNMVLIRKRVENDIWKNLYEFPLIESENQLNIETLEKNNDFLNLFSMAKFKVIKHSEEFNHKLTHRNIKARFFEIQAQSIPDTMMSNFLFIEYHDIMNFPISRLIEKFIEKKIFTAN